MILEIDGGYNHFYKKNPDEQKKCNDDRKNYDLVKQQQNWVL